MRFAYRSGVARGQRQFVEEVAMIDSRRIAVCHRWLWSLPVRRQNVNVFSKRVAAFTEQ